MFGRIAIGLLLTVFLLTAAEAQQPTRIPVVGVLAGSSASTTSTRLHAFRQGLRELAWIEGQTVIIEARYADGNRSKMRELATELVGLRVNVIVATATNTVLAAKEVTTTLPIVTPQVGDPVAGGLATSLARPGGNITGLTQLSPELSGKRFELLKDAFPNVSRVAVLWNPGSPGTVLTFKEMESAAQALGVAASIRGGAA